MSEKELFETTLPVAPLKLAALEGCRELADKVAKHLVVLIEVVGNNGCRGMFAVGCAESIVYINICI